MCAVKIKRSDKLLSVSGSDVNEIQRNTRFYISTDGVKLIKQLPAQGPVGQFKKANGVSEALYQQVMKETGGKWDARIHTKNKSQYTIRQTNLMTGYNVTICNDVNDFRFDNIN